MLNLLELNDELNGLQIRVENEGGENLDDALVHDVAGLVKHFFREMPEPLIPYLLQVIGIVAVLV